MNFSLIFSTSNIDVFSFYSQKNSIQIPLEYWHQAVSASLRLKREVFILEQPPHVNLPEVNRSKRWQLGDGHLWLAPRALSVFYEAPKEVSASYEKMKNYLISAK